MFHFTGKEPKLAFLFGKMLYSEFINKIIETLLVIKPTRKILSSAARTKRFPS
jgi:hypothetical protein